MRRSIIGVCLIALALGVAPGALASPIGDARERERTLRAQLQAATAELEARQVALAEVEGQLDFDRRQLQGSRRRLEAARAALAGQAAAMYRSGGLALADAFLERDPALVPDRVELATVLVAQQADAITDAEVAGEAYGTALQRVSQGEQRARALRDEAKAVVDRLTDRLQAAKQVSARLAAAAEARRRARAAAAAAPAAPAPPAAPAAPVSGGTACPIAQPHSFVDSFGAPRSGGRRHQGVDMMAPTGTRIFAFTDGVVTRQSNSSLGGISVYMVGSNGAEYYYTHLSGYAVPTGTRVRAGQLIAYSGQSGNAAFSVPHLHFEIHPGGPGSTPVNPYPAVKRACG
jgi:murein DD-endopeptidase MepM/ murein hydrolase activator NlpD